MTLMEELTASVKKDKQGIVFPEATDPRILGAASRLQDEEILTPILIGQVDEIKQAAKEHNVSLNDIEIIDPSNYDEMDAMADAFVDRRKGKNTKEEALDILQDNNYFGTMLVYQGLADGMVSGAVHSTGDTVRPALQIVKTRPGVNLVSGSFVLTRDDERYLFADSAINPDPDADQLAEIAVESARFAKAFGIDPKVAMLSYSTYGSAGGPSVEKVVEATKKAQEMAPDLPIDGELQFDAALVESVGKSKAPESDVAGQANVFIFPDLSSGNIGYKIAQRFGDFNALGPLLQGLDKPITDLSRGCSEEDVYQIGIVTAQLALLDKED